MVICTVVFDCSALKCSLGKGYFVNRTGVSILRRRVEDNQKLV